MSTRIESIHEVPVGTVFLCIDNHDGEIAIWERVAEPVNEGSATGTTPSDKLIVGWRGRVEREPRRFEVRWDHNRYDNYLLDDIEASRLIMLAEHFGMGDRWNGYAKRQVT